MNVNSHIVLDELLGTFTEFWILGKKLLVSDPDKRTNVCSGSDSTLNEGLSLFSPRVEKISVAPATTNRTDSATLLCVRRDSSLSKVLQTFNKITLLRDFPSIYSRKKSLNSSFLRARQWKKSSFCEIEVSALVSFFWYLSSRTWTYIWAFFVCFLLHFKVCLFLISLVFTSLFVYFLYCYVTLQFCWLV